MRQSTLTKVTWLREIIGEMESVLVAYSGGVDSTFLLKTAFDTLGPKKVAAFIVSSQVYPKWETAEAHCIASEMGVNVIGLDQDILLMPEAYKENPMDRCYHCKRELLNAAKIHAKAKGYRTVLEGTNADEAQDWRPGLKAVGELECRSPLLDAGLTKDEIREASREMGLPTWDKPSMACLSSRFPHGVEITPERLDKVAACELAIREEGVRQLRVRYHGNLARIEIAKEEFPKLFKNKARERIVSACKNTGFKYISLDLEGYRTGSMNPDEPSPPTTRNKK